MDKNKAVGHFYFWYRYIMERMMKECWKELICTHVACTYYLIFAHNGSRGEGEAKPSHLHNYWLRKEFACSGEWESGECTM
jgi:hypothetical protein